MVILYLFNDTIILLLYGVSYTGSIAPYTILIAGIIFDSYARINGKWIVLKNCQMISLYRTIFGCIINILLNLILIPRYGIIGAAYSTIITLFIAVFIYYLLHKETRDIFITQLFGILTFFYIKKISLSERK